MNGLFYPTFCDLYVYARSKSEKSPNAAVENCSMWSLRNHVFPKDFPDGKVPLPYCGTDGKSLFVALGPRSDFGKEPVD
jgi:hypothetical protein